MSEWMREWWRNPDAWYPELVVTVLLGLGLVLSMRALMGNASNTKPSRVARLVRLALLTAVLGAAASAYGAILRGSSLHGWMLFAHLMAGGAIVVVLPFYALSSHARGLDGALTLASGLGTLLPILLAMSPRFDTEWQYRLLTLHRYAALCFFCAVLLSRRRARMRRT